MLNRSLTSLSTLSIKFHRKLKKILAVQLQKFMPSILWNRMARHFEDNHVLYHKKLKNNLPEKLKTKFSPDIWEIIAGYAFYLDGLRCPLSGELLDDAVTVNKLYFKMMQIVYSKKNLQQIHAAQDREKYGYTTWGMTAEYENAGEHNAVVLRNKIKRHNTITTFARTNLWGEELISLLTKFALRHRQISLIENADSETNELLANIEENCNPRFESQLETFNIIQALKFAIDTGRAIGETNFDLEKFINRYDFPVIKSPGNGEQYGYIVLREKERRNSVLGFGFRGGFGYGDGNFVALIVAIAMYLNYVLSNDAERLYLFGGRSIGEFPVYALTFCNIYHLRDRVFSLGDFIGNGFIDAIDHMQHYHRDWCEHFGYCFQVIKKFFQWSWNEIGALGAALPASPASELLKWFIVASDMMQTYDPPYTLLLNKPWYVLFEAAWLLSGAADMTCKKVVEDCKEMIRKPERVFTYNPPDEYGFVDTTQRFFPAKRLWKMSFVLTASTAAYLATQNPVYTLMAMLSSIQSTAVADCLRSGGNRYRLMSNRSVTQTEAAVTDLKIVWGARRLG